VTVVPGVLTLLCADMDARPLFWTTADGGRDGFEPRAAAIVAEHAGLELRWSFHRWDTFREVLEAGLVDAIWCGSAITAERRLVFDYSAPYAAFDEALLVRADSPIHGPADCAGRTIGAIVDSTNMSLVESLPGAIPYAFDGTSDDVFAEMIEATRSGLVDGFVDDEPAFGGLEAGGEFRVGLVAETQNPWGAAVGKGNDGVRALIDGGLAAAIADGTLAAEWRRWFPAKVVPGVLR
jgi:ABC-type amino acid transport substrate-binding protein